MHRHCAGRSTPCVEDDGVLYRAGQQRRLAPELDVGRGLNGVVYPATEGMHGRGGGKIVARGISPANARTCSLAGGDEILGRADLNDRTVPHVGAAIGDSDGFMEVMGDEGDAFFEHKLQAKKLVLHFPSYQRVPNREGSSKNRISGSRRGIRQLPAVGAGRRTVRDRRARCRATSNACARQRSGARRCGAPDLQRGRRAVRAISSGRFRPAGEFTKASKAPAQKSASFLSVRLPLRRRSPAVSSLSSNLGDVLAEDRLDAHRYAIAGLIACRVNEPVDRLARLDPRILIYHRVHRTRQQEAPRVLRELAGSNTRTSDLDLAQFEQISIALGDAVDLPFLDILKKVDPRFEPIPYAMDGRRATRYAVGDRFRVDILSPNRGPDRDEPVHLPALKSDAQPLRFLDFLLYEEEQAAILYNAGILVNVPAPQRYALHKLIVARQRIETKQSQDKARKDLRQASELFQVLEEIRPFELRAAWDELLEHDPKWRASAEEALQLLDRAGRQAFDRCMGRGGGAALP